MKVSKLYSHKDMLVDMEFRNAYKNLISVAGRAGPDGAAGPPGADGVSHILTAKIVIDDIDTEHLLIRLPAYSFVVDIIGICGAWFNTHGNDQRIEIYDENDFYYHNFTTTVNTTLELPVRILPYTAFLTSLAPTWNRVYFEETDILCKMIGATAGEFYICLNYTIMTDLQSLSS